MESITFNYYGADVRTSTPLGIVTLDSFLRTIENPKPAVKDILNRIRTTTDMTVKDELKRRLYYFTPAVGPMSVRRYEAIQSFTGLAVLDFDKVLNPEITRTSLFVNYPQIVASWLSASRKGVRALLRIPVVSSVDEYKAYFKGFAKYLETNDHYDGFDMAPQNPVLPLFISDDPGIMIRTAPKIWTTTYTEPKPFIRPVMRIKQASDDSRHVFNIIRKCIEHVNSNGHPQLRAAAFALGGYVAAGHVSESEAVEMITKLIERNAYLGQRHKVNGYIKTAKTMIKEGQSKPLVL